MAHNNTKKTADQTHLMHISGFEIELTRKRVRNINLRVRRDGSLALSIPKNMPLAHAERFIEERTTWIKKYQSRALERASEPILWKTGDTISLWGERLTLSLSPDAESTKEGATLHDKVLELHIRADYADDSELSRTHRAALIDAFLTTEMQNALHALLPLCEARVGKSASAIRLRRMVSRWGSCNIESARITLNLALSEYPPPCLEAVLCHELCHLYERNHNQRFYALLDKACPTWREAHATLRKAPPRYT